MGDRVQSPFSPSSPLTPSPLQFEHWKQGPESPLAPPELSRDFWRRQGQTRVAPTPDWDGEFRWEGLSLAGLTDARRWTPGADQDTGRRANERITAAYDRIDGAMRDYLGAPAIANWTTFGKYASREAGGQIARVEAMLSAIAGREEHALPLLGEYLKQPSAFNDLGKKLLSVSEDVPDLLRRTRRLRDALVFGNTQIMMDIGPAFDAFLRAEQAEQDGVAVLKQLGYGQAPRDPQGFLLQAFERYQAARRIALQLATHPSMSHDEALAKMAERRRLVFEANVYIGLEEQMLCLQHPQAFGDAEVAEMIGLISDTMTLKDARGTTRLLPHGGNWADFATRMGLQEVALGTADAIVITGHDQVTRAYRPHPDPKRRAGTILEYFRNNLDMTPSQAMMSADPSPMPEGYRNPGASLKKLLNRVLGPLTAVWRPDRGA